MKKKLFLVIMAVCAALSMAGCMGNTDAGPKESTAAEDGIGEAEVEKETEKNATEATRIVSVNKVEDYVTIAQYKGIELENTVTEVTDEMVETRISEILENASKENKGNKAKIQEGDLITVSYIGTIDGKSFEGGTVTSYDWTVGSEEFFDGFEEGVLGMKRGETKDILCTFPEDYHGAELAGKEVKFTVTVLAVRRTPELDDSWVSENSDVKTVAEYKEVIKAELEASMEVDAENTLKSYAWETVVTNSAMIEYPEKDIEAAKASYNAQMTEYAESYEMDLEAFVESQGLTMEAYEEQRQLYAERKVKQNLIVQGIIDAEGISLDDEECLEIQNQIMEAYGAESLAELIDMYSQVQIDESIALLRVEDFIYENALIVEPVAVVQGTSEEAAETVSEETASGETVSEETAETKEDNVEEKIEETVSGEAVETKEASKNASEETTEEQ